MAFNIGTRNNSNINDVIELLNMTAQDFYKGKIQFVDRSYFSHLKANILSGIIDIERTIRGTFGCDLSMASIDENILKQMYPNACLTMFNDGNSVDIEKLSYYLTSLRNINAHVFISKEDTSFLESDFSFLQNKKHFHGSIKYLNNDKVTVAGILFIILNFLRSQSIAILNKDDYLVGVISNGKYELDDGQRFVNEISHTNLEIEIRKKRGSDVATSIMGELFDKASTDGTKYSISIGRETYPTFKVDCTLDGNRLIIQKRSLTRTYYKEDYVLKIEDEKEFIRLANLLPPFGLVDYLYESGITVFNKESASVINGRFEIISKINRPKFYADKNLALLMFKDKASDFRIMSSLMTDGLSRLLLATENFIYRTRKINRGSDYTSLAKALSYINTPDEILNEVIYLRNFCAHGYILNDYLIYRDEVRQFTLEYIIKTIKSLSDFLERNQKDVFNNFKEYKREFLINKILKIKYKIAINYTDKVIDDYPKYDKKELAKKNAFIKNSFFDVTMFNEITNFEIQKIRVIQVHLPDTDDCLYFYDNTKSRERLDFFCSCFGYEIISEKDCGLIIEIELSK